MKCTASIGTTIVEVLNSDKIKTKFTSCICIVCTSSNSDTKIMIVYDSLALPIYKEPERLSMTIHGMSPRAYVTYAENYHYSFIL